MSDLNALAWAACDTVNRIVECDGASWQDRHEAIQRVREHLEARAGQTAPPWPEDQTNDFSDLLGV